MALGEARLYRYLQAFGFGQKTEIDLPGEMGGLLKPPTEWGRRSVASISIGQEIGVTSIQMVTAISAIANGGLLMHPYVVSAIRDAKGSLVSETTPSVRRRVISPGTAKALRGILEGVVSKGTGSRAAIPGFRVAGKTGTAQKIDARTGTYSSTQFVGSFVGFVPAESPRIAMIVVIDEPEGEAWGGVVAAPVFKRVGEQVLSHLGVAPVETVKVALADAGL
jgi:cell division protein FtsI (penicillin-binding protein 3)